MSLIETKFCKYLKQGNFEEFMLLWKKQKERLGHIGGSIQIYITNENQEDLEGLLGIFLYPNQMKKITWKQLEKAITKTKFEHCNFELVLDLYFQSTIIGRKQIQQEKEQDFLSFIERLKQHTESEYAYNWLTSCVEQKNSTYVSLRKQYFENQEDVKKYMQWVLIAIEELPCLKNQSENIAIFASRITGDPHAFDFGKFANYLLFQAIIFILQLNETAIRLIEKNEVFARAGLDKDEISNFCMISGLNAYDKNHNLHEGWNGFYKSREIWNVNVANLRSISCIDPLSCERVIVIENPSIFQFLHNEVDKNQQRNIGFVCTNGQLNYCGYLLLDEIVKANISLYYCGDMDPEGLLIADRLKQRYKEHLHLWLYEEEDYELAKSKQYASEKRCQMLKQIQTKKLQTIAIRLCNHEAIGYQENLREQYRKRFKEFE